MKRGRFFEGGTGKSFARLTTRACTNLPKASAAFAAAALLLAMPAMAQEAEVQEPGPGFDTLLEETENLPERTPDGWYDVGEAELAEGRAANLAQGAGEATEAAQSDWALLDRLKSQMGATISLMVLLALLLTLIVWRVLRRKREARQIHEETTPVLTSGIRASMGEVAEPEVARASREGPQGEAEGSPQEVEEPEAEAPEPEPEPQPEPEPEPEPQPEPQPEPEPVPVPLAAGLSRSSPAIAASAPQSPATPRKPLDVDLSLDIISATRSIMHLMVEFSLEIFNRSDTPIIGLGIAAELACVSEGAATPAPVDKTQPIGTLERLAPQQVRRVKGYLELPAQEVNIITQESVQGERRFYIPLVHLRIAEHNQPAIKRTFVLGTPSASSPNRVHPLPLEVPPGRLPMLRAQLIGQPA